MVLAPLGRDAELVRRTLAEAGQACRVCPSMHILDAEPLDGIAVLVVTEEVLSTEALRLLRARLEAQPPWSTLPLIAFSARGGSGAAWAGLEACTSAGLVLLERPIRIESFVSIVRAAVAARRRQFQLRDELAARAAAEAPRGCWQGR
ncbi:hypothetical protein [Coralloluteibacterium stylophorae]|uniref:Uncharacterized protein n=1 Tax=Coralloluteibacterium stylophorae TaxID=1776034 RepID=A0A8J7VS30_9GAMM|nr:hypothetical protein [Coralloluteibacterium stylophorae]MBS7457320.1 hypothetical protein [Coralloluteibacterium stylophorae]